METYHVHERVTSRVIEQKHTLVHRGRTACCVYANLAYFATMNYWILTCHNLLHITIHTRSALFHVPVNAPVLFTGTEAALSVILIAPRGSQSRVYDDN